MHELRIHDVTPPLEIPAEITPLEKILNMALTRTSNPNRPTSKGFFFEN